MTKKSSTEFAPPNDDGSPKAPVASPDWIFEIKLDGYRAITVFDSAGQPHLWSRNGLSLEAKFLAIANAVNAWLEPLNDLTGFEFIHVLDGFLGQHPVDIVVINPLTAYLGANDKDTKAATLFLRNSLNPVLSSHNCAAIIVHHTPKTNFASTDNYKPSDWMYRGAGAATITNWARAILVIDPGKQPGVYRFIAATKRGRRIGWASDLGNVVFETLSAHSNDPDKLLWVPANADQ